MAYNRVSTHPAVDANKACWLDARRALEAFRTDGDTTGFKDLRWWLWQNSKSNVSFDLSGFGQDDLGLNEEEYQRFKEAYKETPVGAASILSS